MDKKTPATDNLTPMMKQYQEIKNRKPDHILFYRLGDFYEMFFDDAVTGSRVLNITLTTRGKHLGTEIPLAGFPHHQIDNYLSKMIKAGYKVAVCDQTEDPKKAKGIVKRDITEIVTAGTALSDQIVESGRNNYLAAVCRNKNGEYGFAAADITTGEFTAYDTCSEKSLTELIMHFDPSEIITHENAMTEQFKGSDTSFTFIPEKKFFSNIPLQLIRDLYGVVSFSSFGFEGGELSLLSAGIIIEYLAENISSKIPELNRIKKYSDDDICVIDYKTRRNLEILESYTDGKNAKTLYSVMNKTQTPMGSRLLKKWLTAPLRDKEEILRRLNITEILVRDRDKRCYLSSILSRICDIERLAAKIDTGRISPDELIRLKRSLEHIPELRSSTAGSSLPELKDLGERFDGCPDFVELIESSIEEESGRDLKSRFIKKGFCRNLDELYELSDNGKDKIVALAEKVKKDIGIPGMKIGYNRVFGYYFETTKKYSDIIPEGFIRKQTLVNSERFINTELKEYEDSILGADEKIEELTKEIFSEIKKKLVQFVRRIRADSYNCAYLDCLISYAEVSDSEKFSRPEFSAKKEIFITNGRHPVVEKNLASGEDYIPNDLTVTEDKNILIITGPNMSGKSTFLRQTAIIVLLAQAGCFVPADKAVLGMTDRIFTRVGASDNLSGGESTFLVEMNETANILNYATPDSLVIFDEVGRGTATFDGLSLAWSIVEYIHNEPKIASRTLFATHYHELTEIERICHRVKNFHASVVENKDEVIFMRRIIEGSADHSYGIYVAKLAGIPEKVLKRAKIILRNLEENELTPDSRPVIARDRKKKNSDVYVNLFDPENDRIREALKAIDPESITPIEAINRLNELKKLL